LGEQVEVVALVVVDGLILLVDNMIG
jgi:hypothetical protein